MAIQDPEAKPRVHIGGTVRWISGVVIALIVVVGCGKKDEETSGAPFTGPSGNVLYDSTVSQEYQTRIQKDLDHISTLSGLAEYKTDQQVMGLSDFKGPALSGWLRQRIQYVAGEGYDLTKNTTSTYSPNAYPPVVFSDVANWEAQLAAITVMSNIGAASYLDGKSENKVNELTIAEQKVKVLSPRVSIFKIGAGLMGTNNRPKGFGMESIAAIFSRIATYFHEARHDDGNGEHAAFAHAMCPDDHDMSGNYACDKRSNGPYPIEAMLLWKFYLWCKNNSSTCSSTELAFLLARFNDDNGRMLYGATYVDPNPEKIR